MKGFRNYLSKEIGIEFKACLYFFCILLFYCTHRMVGGSMEANILYMAEMILTTYLMGYLQVYLLKNFDEAEKLSAYVVVASAGCSGLYAIISYLCHWFDRSMGVTILFFFYLWFAYVCVVFVYKIKRDYDTKALNQNLEAFKKQKNENRGGHHEK